MQSVVQSGLLNIPTTINHKSLKTCHSRSAKRSQFTTYAAATVTMAPKPVVIATGQTAKDKLEAFTAFDLDAFVAGKSRNWSFWNSPPATFPWEYTDVEHAIILEGKFSVQYDDGGEAVEIKAGDFVKFPVGKTTFVVKENARKFFTLGE